MKLFGSTENKITKDKNGENVPHLEITEVVLVHYNTVNNDYQPDLRVQYTFVQQMQQSTFVQQSTLWDYSDAYILVKGNITVNNTTAADVDANNTNKKVIFKNCALFTNCISETNNRQVHNAKDIDIVMLMHNLIILFDV